ncbi:peroxidase 64 [Dorcoceras hygrometricum]|uniref:Peroxidase 64 n=1 Tax=Dorcoceras hygrometricum TaxID=472368 RepID=A0A2Z7DE65_9LAMI|nr:peroxidase 64 [Dorcoceras hygrometricum]
MTNNSTVDVRKPEGGQLQRRSEAKKEARIVSQQEFQRRKDKGLCFRCGEPYSPMHKCAFKLMQVALLESELEEEGATEETELPLFSISGMTQPQTMKLRGRIKDEEVIVMVDSGASHNFVSRKLVEKLGLEIDEAVRFGVCLGDGTKVRCQGLCLELVVQLGTYTVAIVGHLFELGGVDVILGVEWLRTLGEVLLDWNKMKMRFKEGKHVVELKGDPTLERIMLSLKSICKVTEVEFSATLFTVMSTHRDGIEETREHPKEIQEVLNRFRMIFDKPQELHLSRSQDHATNIKDGQGPVQVRPYRYAHRQKNENERLVTEMLAAGVIQPSTSPYSSPVILVKRTVAGDSV